MSESYRRTFVYASVALLIGWIAVPLGAMDHLCTGFGPQSPRDIDALEGTNDRVFSIAPPNDQLNLCNIHFHKHAEHRASAYSSAATDGAGGYRCSDRASSTGGDAVCGGVTPGDTIEVHWVYSSCDVAPGPGLGSCLSDSCANPDLRVEAQVFVVSNNSDALDFGTFDATATLSSGYHQPKALPTGTGTPVVYHGSTTGPSYDEKKCSPLQVTWSVRPQCAAVSASSLESWCSDNVFDEDHAHGVRELVTEPSLLSAISSR